MKPLGELVAAAGDAARLVRGAPETGVQGIATDSRAVRPGDLFAALSGRNADGHRFLGAAATAGAAALLVEPGQGAAAPRGVALVEAANLRRALGTMADCFFDHPSGDLQLVGVTGTNGKTTVTWILEAIVRAAGRVPGVIGTILCRWGGLERPAGNTTPEAPELQKLLRVMVDAGVQIAALEASSHALELDRLAGCRFAAAVFTNLGRDHLDFHHGLEAYGAAKAKLFTAFAPGASVINADDLFGARLIPAVGGTVITYGVGETAALRAVEIVADADGVRFVIAAEGRRLSIVSPLIGVHNVANILAAAGAARALGLSWDAVQAGVAACALVPGRFERVGAGSGAGSGPLVLVDFAHTPEAVENALRVARGLCRGNLAIVLGCGGDRDRGKRPLMGAAAATLADRVYVTSDNPRSEEPSAILAQIVGGARASGGSAELQVIENRRAAIQAAIRDSVAGDLVLIAGKGHENTQVIGGESRHFSDREEARRALEEFGCPA
ncbi:MAG: UDP-N-acetylmuramoyl-L-alanyl-D-glutamate--2,6-diaminopimelate ligase [Candidatus Methylomirabilia bacterium]